MSYWRGTRSDRRLSISRVAVHFGFEHQNLAADRENLARLAAHGNDPPGHRRGYLDRCLLRHHVDDMLVLIDHVADLDVPGNKFRLRRALSHVRQFENIPAHLKPPSYGEAPQPPAMVRENRTTQGSEDTAYPNRLRVEWEPPHDGNNAPEPMRTTLRHNRKFGLLRG